MTLHEAIQHLQETLSDNNHEWGCEECRKEHEQLLEWLRELEDYRRWKYKSSFFTNGEKHDEQSNPQTTTINA